MDDTIRTATSKGWRLFPCNGKIPALKGKDWHEIATTDLEQLGNWSARYNLALCIPEDIVVLDVDPRNGGKVPEGLPPTPKVITGGGGYHFYFLRPSDLQRIPGTIGEGLELKKKGSCVVYPGSVHPGTGKEYCWEQGQSLDDVALAEFPVNLIPPEPDRQRIPNRNSGNISSRYLEKALESACSAVGSAQQGSRNDTLNREAYNLGGLLHVGLDEKVVVDALLNAALEADLPENEARRTIQDAITRGMSNPREVKLDATKKSKKVAETNRGNGPESMSDQPADEADRHSDLAAARRLYDLHGDRLLYDLGLGWMVYNSNSGMWESSESAAARFAHELGAAIRHEVHDDGLIEPSEVTLWYRYAKRMESEAGIRAVLSIAKTLDGIDATRVEWDAHPWFLNCENGIVDLKSGQLKPHEPGHYITKNAGIPYLPNAKAPRWEKFLAEVFDNDQELIDYLQWACGYSLTGVTAHQCWFVLHGSGRNGKSTLINVIQHILGDYAQQLDPEEIMQQKHARHSTELAMLKGARFVATVETAEGKRLNESLIKTLTGGDKIRARFMRKDSFEYRPQLKLWMATNHRPTIRDDSHGMWRRVRLLPFNVAFKDEQCNPELFEILKAEAPGILAWAVRGAALAIDGEPTLPDAVKAANEEYRSDQDVIGNFLQEECDLDAGSTVTVAALYQAFVNWSNGRCEPISTFSKRLKARGFESTRTGSVRLWKGISLIRNELWEHRDD